MTDRLHTLATDALRYDRVRRAAKRAGLIIRKSRSRDGYMLLDSGTRACVAGSWFELSAEEALARIENIRASMA
jgi:hypothetical protein